MMPDNLFLKSGYGLSVKLNINCNKTNNPVKNYGVLARKEKQNGTILRACRIVTNAVGVISPGLSALYAFAG